MLALAVEHQTCMTILIVPIVLVLGACASARYIIHPGALNSIDSAAYDALLVAESAIDQGRTDLENGRLPENAKDALTRLVAAYNLARQSWLTYRGSLSTNIPADAYLDHMNKSLVDLAAALRAFQEAQ